MKTLVGSENSPDPVDPYAVYRVRYQQVMTDIAKALRKSVSFNRK